MSRLITPKWARRWWLLGVWAGLLALWYVLPLPSAWLESVYSRGIYPGISRVLSPLVMSAPWSWSMLLLLGLPLLGLGYSLHMLKGRHYRRWLWVTGISVLTLASSFVFLWGAHYRRASIEEQLGLAQVRPSEAALQDLLAHLLAELHAYAASPQPDKARALAAISQALHTQLNAPLPAQHVPHIPQTVKTLPAGSLLYFGSLGVMSPWLLEPHVDGGLPEPFFIAVAAHELAHTAGFAGEADADMMGMLAALRAEHPYARYAGALAALRLLMVYVPSEQRAALREQIPPLAKQHYAAYQASLERYRSPAWLEQGQQLLYDRYLRSQGVDAGIADYGRSAQLLLRAYVQGYLR